MVRTRTSKAERTLNCVQWGVITRPKHIPKPIFVELYDSRIVYSAEWKPKQTSITWKTFRKKKCLCAWQAMIRYHSSSNTSLFSLDEEREHRCLHFMDNLCACFRFSTINSETFWLERYPRLLNNKVICITVWFDMNGGIILEYVLMQDFLKYVILQVESYGK